MNEQGIFHLAIPCTGLEEAIDFYVDGLGCRLARRKEDRVSFEFFGAQVVCHLHPEAIDPDPEMYPRHFGITLLHESEFEQVLERARSQNLSFFRQVFSRFEGNVDEHRAFFLRDPSNNLVEFKHYRDPSMIY